MGGQAVIAEAPTCTIKTTTTTTTTTKKLDPCSATSVFTKVSKTPSAWPGKDCPKRFGKLESGKTCQIQCKRNYDLVKYGTLRCDDGQAVITEAPTCTPKKKKEEKKCTFTSVVTKISNSKGFWPGSDCPKRYGSLNSNATCKIGCKWSYDRVKYGTLTCKDGVPTMSESPTCVSKYRV